MGRRFVLRRIILLFCSFILLYSFSTYPAVAGNKITDLRYSSDLDSFRVVFEFEKKTDYQIYYLGSPSRIIVEMESLSFPASRQILTFSDPSVTRIEVEAVGKNVQASMELTENITNFQGFTLEDPHRLVIDITRDLEYVRDFQVLVAPGLFYRQIHRRGILDPLLINILEVDLDPGSSVGIQPVLAHDRITEGEAVSSMSQRYQALAAVNGTFFDGNYRPLGMLVMDGLLVSEPLLNRTVLGVLEDGGLIMDQVQAMVEAQTPLGNILIHGLNRPPQEGEVILYNHPYGLQMSQEEMMGFVIQGGRITKETSPGEVLPGEGFILAGRGSGGLLLRSMLEVGTLIYLDISYQPSYWNSGLLHAIGGGPRLVQDGEKFITAVSEHFRPDVVKGRAPRTALGITDRGNLLIVTVSGRSQFSIGMTLDELAELMMDLGAVDAMNLDGGGSTTMILRQRVFNLPSSGEERRVSNALLVVPRE